MQQQKKFSPSLLNKKPLISTEVLEKVKDLTGGAESFLKKKRCEQRVIQHQIDTFLGVDRTFSSISAFNPRRSSKSKELSFAYTEEILLFKTHYFFRNRVRALTSCAVITEEIEQVVSSLLLAIGFSKKLFLIDKDVFAQNIFSEIIAICLEQGQKNLLENSELFVTNNLLLINLTNWVAQNALYTIMGNPCSKTIIKTINFISKPIKVEETAELVYAFNKAAGKLADMAISCAFLSGLLGQPSTSFNTEDFKKEKSYDLSHMKVNMGLFSRFLPRFIRPETIKRGDTKELKCSEKPIFAGNGSIQWSPRMVKFLNLANHKAFKINEKVLNSLQDLVTTVNDSEGACDPASIDVCVTQLHFYPDKVLKPKFLELQSAQQVLNEQIFDLSAYNRFIADKKKSDKAFKYSLASTLALKALDIDPKAIQIYHNVVALQKEYANMVKKNELFFLKIQAAEILKGLPLFYRNSFDYRGRFYSEEWLFGKTTGWAKWLVQDFCCNQVTYKGVQTLLKAFSSHSARLKAKCEVEISSTMNLTSLFLLWNKIKANSFNLKHTSCFIYFNLLYVELNCLQKAYKQGAPLSLSIWVERDQSCSGSVFLALISRLRVLGLHSQLLGVKTSGVYSLIQESYKLFFSKETLPLLFTVLEQSRVFTKKVFMTYCYGQSSKMRAVLVKNILQSEGYHNILTAAGLSQEIRFFSNSYENYIDTVFNGLNAYLLRLKKLEKAVSALNGNQILIRTIDGGLLSWSFNKVDPTFPISNFDPVTRKNKTIHIPRFSLLMGSGTNVDKSRLSRSFIPGFVHSLDAGFIRLVLGEVYSKANYMAVSCHDSIQIHPEFDNTLEEVIGKLYSSSFPSQCVKELYFVPSTASCVSTSNLKTSLDFLKEVEGNISNAEIKVFLDTMYPLEH